ncbi:hypothetical protein LINPERPRIM_LOCUS11629 [Linum perenne]
MRTRSSRRQSPFPFLNPGVQQNGSSSPRACSIQGPLMDHPKLPDRDKPAVVGTGGQKLPDLNEPLVDDAEEQNSGTDFVPEMQKLETNKDERSADNARVSKRERSIPECSRPVVLALRAYKPDDEQPVRKRGAKKQKDDAAEPKTEPVMSPQTDVGGHNDNKGKESINCFLSSDQQPGTSSLTDNAEGVSIEDQELFLEVVDALLTGVPPKRKRGRPRKVRQ